VPAHDPTPTTPRHLSVALSRPDPASTVCTVTGEVDLASAPALSAQLHHALTTHPARLIIDMTAVTLLGAAGIHVLEDIQMRCAGCAELTLVYTGEPVRTVLALCGITNRIHSFNEMNMATASLTGPDTPHVPRQRAAGQSAQTGVPHAPQPT
jgi:anti-anti-sigma factor